MLSDQSYFTRYIREYISKKYILTTIILLITGLSIGCNSGTQSPVLLLTFKQVEGKILNNEILIDSEIKNFSQDELRKLRNVVFAKYGKVYQRPGLGDYFATCDWYRPNSSYKDSDADQLLTSVDKQNVQTIQNQEGMVKVTSTSVVDSTPSPVITLKKNDSIYYSLSSDAKEISDLIDNESYEAAETLSKSYIQQNPKDAGLYCQYVRLLIKGFPMSDDPFIESPVITGDRFRVSAVIDKSITLATQFDPNIKSYLSDLILGSLYGQISILAENNEGYIGLTIMQAQMATNPIASMMGGANKIRFAHDAIRLDPSIGKKWEEKYRNLVPKFVASGKATSAMWTANLSGDLSNGADPNSNADFEQATQAFIGSLSTGKTSVEVIDAASAIYTEVFADDIRRVSRSKDANYTRLTG